MTSSDSLDPLLVAEKLPLAEKIRQACIQAVLEGYEDAAIRGLCHEGAFEAAISTLRRLDLEALIESS